MPVLGICGEPADAESAPSDPLHTLVKQLGAERFSLRQKAHRRLEDLGPVAAGALRSVRDVNDPDVRRRAAQLLSRLGELHSQGPFLESLRTRWMPGLMAGELSPPFAGSLGAPCKYVPRKLDSAVRTGLEGGLGFLVVTQARDGHWDAKAFGAQYPADVEQTSLALLAFLTDGSTERVGRHVVPVRRAVGWLAKRQRRTGELCNPGWEGVDCAAHALGTWALCEAAGTGQQPATKASAQRAVDFLAWYQDPGSGGFCRNPELPPDLFTTMLAALAYRTAKVAGLEVRFDAFEGILKFLEEVELKDGRSFSFMAGGNPSVQATLCGTLCQRWLGWKREDVLPKRDSIVAEIRDASSALHGGDAWLAYLITEFAFWDSRELWREWTQIREKNFTKRQFTDGPWGGAYRTEGRWAGCGLLFNTSMATAARAMRPPRWYFFK